VRVAATAESKAVATVAAKVAAKVLGGNSACFHEKKKAATALRAWKTVAKKAVKKIARMVEMKVARTVATASHYVPSMVAH
jgi:hypothetical protein